MIARLLRALAGGRCAACCAALAAPGLCEPCREALAPRENGYCPRCARLNDDAPHAPPQVCPACRDASPAWDAVGFYGAYEGLLRTLILRWKFGRTLTGARILADLAVQAWRDHAARPDGLDPDGPDLVLAVPMHRRGLLRRGFNQSLELARGLGAALDVRVDAHALTRLRRTASQRGLDAKARRANVAGAFGADLDRVAGARVLLVDDVMTTGATLDAASRALRAAGAARVEALVLARD